MTTQELYHSDDLCYFCGHKTDARSANPGLWPIYLCHSDEPGKAKAHCTSCVDQRLEALETLQTERNAALKLLGYDEAENDPLTNITRLKAHYEQELAYVRDRAANLRDYALKLQRALEAISQVDYRKHDYDYGRTFAETQDIAIKALSSQ